MQRVILVLLVTLLAACGPALPAEYPTTGTPSATATRTPRPPATVTETPWPTYPPVPTPYQLPNSVAEPEGDDLSSLLPVFREIPVEFFRETIRFSPSGQWMARSLRIEARAGYTYEYVRLEIVSADFASSFTGYEEVFYPGLGGPYPTILAWSEDNGSAYLSMGSGSDGCVLFWSYSGLTRIDLSNGQLTQLADRYLGDAAVSADGSWLANVPAARLSEERYSVHLTNLNTGELKEIQIPLGGANAAGTFVWSPDSSQVAFTLIKDGCESFSQHAILVLDVDTLEIQIVLDFQSEYLFAEEWIEGGLILKRTELGRIYTDVVDYWILDLGHGQLSPYEFKP